MASTKSQIDQYRKLRRRRGRVLSVVVMSLFALAILIGAVSFYGDHVGDFVIMVEKDTIMSLTLCENREFTDPRTVLTPAGVKDQTNSSFFDLPLDKANHPDTVVGESEMFYSFETHPGGNHSDTIFNSYFAYTFYLKNTSKVSDMVDYSIKLALRTTVGSVDEAIRVMVIRNRDVLGEVGNRWIYAKAERDEFGERITDSGINTTTTRWGESYDSIIFASSDSIGTIEIKALPAQAIDDFTVVMWVEGDDPDCTNEIKGGKVMLDMSFDITSG